MSSDVQHERYYAARAPEYDASVGYGSTAIETALAPLKARLAERLKGLDVLEIACGTGYWTNVAARTARSILAVDFDSTSLGLAQTRMAMHDHVSFHRADAYRLDGVPSEFTGAFGMFWWSHMPHARIGEFLDALHSKLQQGASVTFADQMPYAHTGSRHTDNHGNAIEERALFDGTRFEIVKNFPTAKQMSQWLERRGRDVEFITDPNSRLWLVNYRVA
ncbi:class I SAM-dependent methyltransferase [Trinickia acidisoli]|uniref:class I SAM-dependent methyltransferase n=1 Tax=Trinickia acidisoli TaxID=2767482 RepID=UPI001A8FB13E|nr:class I SAM-dependent methyltransferase [Trinickia acidisoli]